MSIKMIQKSILVLMSWLLVNSLAHAVLTIEITQGSEGAQPIAIVPFEWSAKSTRPASIKNIIAADLQRSGQFAPLLNKDLISKPHDGAKVNYQTWRALNVGYLVVGKIHALADGSFQVQFQLLDVFNGRQLAGYSIRSLNSGLRRTAHHISDIIYKTVTGEEGAFNTHISYITVTKNKKNKKRYQLAIADADGYNEKIIYTSPQPLMSPTWSPDGTRLAYVSFLSGRPEIVVQNIYSAKRETLASFKGLNNAPRWSPDGKYIALTLSKDGNPEIYIMNVNSRKLTRITRSYAIDTEAEWLPNNKGLVFTSDRGGSPQLYEIKLSNNRPASRAQRLTFEGNYNSRPAVSSDGRYIAMVNRSQGKFRVAVLERETKHFNILTKGTLDESPSFAPNGRMIIYATEQKYRGILSAVSVDGRARQRLSFKQGDVREPVWSPYTINK
ncbi:MAG TPA: Tol-Pal system beta propeller repeat protein TolB [Gammaproteobacteria bacterium]|nr:Tol-Pal system beta propeller repeat protein TolB [Gammaproteobacteria bacterium]